MKRAERGVRLCADRRVHLLWCVFKLTSIERSLALSSTGAAEAFEAMATRRATVILAKCMLTLQKSLRLKVETKGLKGEKEREKKVARYWVEVKRKVKQKKKKQKEKDKKTESEENRKVLSSAYISFSSIATSIVVPHPIALRLSAASKFKEFYERGTGGT